MIISRTPVRLSFFGGGTDYREYYERHGGAVIGTAINKFTYVSLNRLSNFFEYSIRIGYSKAELVNAVADIVHPSVRECLRFMGVDGNLDIHIFADLPARTGLGSSSSFTVGFLNALYALAGRVVPRHRLALEAIHVEQEMIRENVGSQDQMHAAHGGFNRIDFDRDGIRVQPVVISTAKRQLLEQSVMLFYTGQTRLASDIVKEQVQRTKAAANDRHLARMRRMVDEAVELFSDAEPEAMVRRMGELMHESWALKRSLAGNVSTSVIDEVYSRGMEAGAFGGKVAGAGGGGFVLLVVHPDRKATVRQALDGYLEVDVRFEDEGSTIIYMR